MVEIHKQTDHFLFCMAYSNAWLMLFIIVGNTHILYYIAWQ